MIKNTLILLILLFGFEASLIAKNYLPPTGIIAQEIGINEVSSDRSIFSISEVSGYYNVNNQIESNHQMPIGIPDPGFGINNPLPTYPTSWTSEIPGYYYIDQQVGTDTNTYGTPSEPRQSIPNPIPAGSYLVMNGSYSLAIGGVIRVHGNGTSANWVANQSGPIWITGTGNANPAEFVSYKMVISGSYVYFDNILVHNGSRFQVGSSTVGYAANHIMLRNSELIGRLSDSQSSMVSANGGSLTDTAHHVVFFNNQIHDTGDVASTTDDDAHILTTGNYTSYIWGLENTLYNSSGAGVQINGVGQSENCHHIFFGKNHVYNTRQAGLWVKFGEDVIFSENHVHDVVNTSWSPSKAMGAQYEPQRFWMINNQLHGARYGIRIASTSSGTVWNVYAIGNIIYDIHNIDSYGTSSWDEACIHMHGGVNRYIINNTLNNCDAGINGSSTTGSYYIHNNIINDITEPNGNHVWVEYALSGSNIDNNLLYQTSQLEKIKWGNQVFTVNEFETTYPLQSQGNVVDAPLFVNPLGNNFQLQNTSPAIDAGVESDVYQTFFNLYGIDIRRDFAGNTRPIGNSWDIGAFELPVDLIFQDSFE